MSEASQGSSWWQASDGKWYAPELYPAGWPPPVGTPTAEVSSVQGPPDPWAPSTGPPEAGEVPQNSSPSGVKTRPDVVAAVLGAAGAGLVAVGSLLDWATVSGEGMAGTVNGLSDSNGAGTLAVGAVVAVAVGLLLAGQRRWWVGAGGFQCSIPLEEDLMSYWDHLGGLQFWGIFCGRFLVNDSLFEFLRDSP